MSISVTNLNFSYGNHKVLKNVSFEAENGKLIAVLGPNGVGKSTLFRCILGILKGYEGSITIDDQNAATISARELAHRVAYIPQSHGQAFNYSVLDMVLMGTSHSLSPFSVPKQSQIDKAEAAIERAGISFLKDKNYTHLSGGEQQLVIIARALAQDTNMLLMDEPTSNLDYGNQTRVLELVRSLADEGYTILLSTHNPQHAIWYADFALALNGGELISFGVPSKIVDNHLIKQLYDVDVRFIDAGGIKVIAPEIYENNIIELPTHTAHENTLFRHL